ncbi:carbohydrate ABC transporter permease [Pseudalkalibacillus sp. A8]|uniref:carbohydrate ABC transporter permease n=1 Tax=Pseudalkalibacillus sp. A8 TaxID=3382641 RepID=UPI0038B64DB0
MEGLRKSNSKLLSVVLSILAFLWVFPFLFVLINFAKSGTVYNLGDFWDIPKEFSIGENIEYINDRISIYISFFNSLFYGVAGSVLSIIIAALAAYGVTKLNIKGKFYWFLLIYSGTVFPFQMYLVPIYRAYVKTGLYDTQFGMILFYAAISIPFCTFVLRNFFQATSNSLSEAAKIDGASDFQIFYKIYLPMSKAPIAALFLFQFSFIWNDLLFGLTFSKSVGVRPIMPNLSALAGTGGAIGNVPAMLLACLVASIPTVFIYSVLNKHLEKGFVMTSK